MSTLSRVRKLLLIASAFAADVSHHSASCHAQQESAYKQSRTYYGNAIGLIRKQIDSYESLAVQVNVDSAKVSAELAATNQAMMSIQCMAAQSQQNYNAAEKAAHENIKTKIDQVLAKYPVPEDRNQFDPTKRHEMAADYEVLQAEIERASAQLMEMSGQISSERNNFDSLFRTMQRTAAQLGSLQQQQELLVQKWNEINSDILKYADFTRVRSDTELKDAESQILPLVKKFPTARILLVVTQLRLGDYQNAEILADQLVAEKSYLTPLALAIRGEIYARTGLPSKLAAEQFVLATQLDPKNPYILLLRAQTNAFLKQPEQAVKDWRLLASSPNFEAESRRSIALALCMHESDFKQGPELALKEAKLANNKSGDADWSAQLALAFALASSGDKEAAIQKAIDASKNAVAENKRLCLKVAKAVELDLTPHWDF